jgi:hypothetical protein
VCVAPCVGVGVTVETHFSSLAATPPAEHPLQSSWAFWCATPGVRACVRDEPAGAPRRRFDHRDKATKAATAHVECVACGAVCGAGSPGGSLCTCVLTSAAWVQLPGGVEEGRRVQHG